MKSFSGVTRNKGHAPPKGPTAGLVIGAYDHTRGGACPKFGVNPVSANWRGRPPPLGGLVHREREIGRERERDGENKLPRGPRDKESGQTCAVVANIQCECTVRTSARTQQGRTHRANMRDRSEHTRDITRKTCRIHKGVRWGCGARRREYTLCVHLRI